MEELKTKNKPSPTGGSFVGYILVKIKFWFDTTNPKKLTSMEIKRES